MVTLSSNRNAIAAEKYFRLRICRFYNRLDANFMCIRALRQSIHVRSENNVFENIDRFSTTRAFRASSDYSDFRTDNRFYLPCTLRS